MTNENEQPAIGIDDAAEARGFARLITGDEDKVLADAERRRRAKAAQMPQLNTPVPSEIEQIAARKFAAITERLKIAPHEAVTNLERESKVEALRRNWNAPARHVAQTTLNGFEWRSKLAEVKRKIGTGCLLAFVGKRGPGKTQMGVELMRYQTGERLKSAKFCDAIDIFVSLRATYGDHSTRNEGQAIAEWVRPDLLVIDEIHERGETQWEDRILVNILNKRYDALKDTIIIANLTAMEIERSLGPSIWARLCQTGGVVLFDWESFR